MNKPFDRTIINALARPISGDINQLQSQLDRTLREVVMRSFAPRTSLASAAALSSMGGFLGDGFQVSPKSPASGQLTMKAGIGFMSAPGDVPSAIGGILGLDDLSPLKPIVLPQDVTITVPASPGSNARIDLIEVRYNRLATDSASLDIFDTITGEFGPGTKNKTLASILGSSDVTFNGAGAINYKTGSSAAVTRSGPTLLTPAAPAVDSGYIPVAWVFVNSGTYAGIASGTFGNTMIADKRQLLFPGGGAMASILYNASATVGSGGAPTLAYVIGPPGIPIYVTQDVTPTIDTGFYVFGNLVAVPQVQIVGAVTALPRLQVIEHGAFDNGIQAILGSATACATPDPDPPGSAFTEFLVQIKDQKGTANYDFSVTTTAARTVSAQVHLQSR